jgi:hypothetical protein
MTGKPFDLCLECLKNVKMSLGKYINLLGINMLIDRMKVQLDSWGLADSSNDLKLIDGMSVFQFQSIRFGLLLVSIQVHDISFKILHVSTLRLSAHDEHDLRRYRIG